MSKQFSLKKFSTFLLFLLIANIGFSQILKPVKWSFSVNRINDCEAELIFKAKIDKGFHVYSQFLDGNDGPVATTFNFEKSKDCNFIGKVIEGKPIEEYDPNFEMKLKFFANEATFKQKIKITNSKAFTIKGYLNYMVCDDTKCLPPEDVDFEFKLEAANGKSCTDEKEKKSDINKIDTGAIKPVDVDSSQNDTTKVEVIESNSVDKDIIKADDDQKPENKGAWAIFVAGFLGGLLALLTPCVFPMIPLTVSFFTKSSGNRKKGLINALIYGLSIILIYVTLGMIITLSLGPDALNAMASNAIVNLAFFIIFVVFATSFLGAFEITLPSSWVNKADSASEKGGLIGIFFMAFTLSLVSFSCTGPIIGTLLVQAAVGGNVINPTIGMIGFSSALALPFGLFAAFPGWLNSLPKSGGWLNSVKVVLGLLELALALKFLSNVDLAYHWGILTREVFIALWIVIFSLLGFYLLGKLKFSHDSDTKYISIPKAMFAIIVFGFVVYLIPGMFGAPLKIISGFPPPTFYNEGWSLGNGSPNDAGEKIIPGTDPEHCPHNLNCFHDYNLALAYAKEVKKPLMVDFTGWSCVNCRKMEDNVWVDPRVLERLSKDYVLVSLYVDDKTSLPEAEKHISKTTGNKIKTIGNKWSDMQTERFGTNSQPYYVLLDANEQMLNKPTGYDPDIEKFIAFLDEGKKVYSNK
ncbi:MAG TPA: cytochrome c biogenesis protein CcdA [Bacteroidia bacterium]|nr:cytochrome c biogenesis protein CcdA [Bacteroidia bacterium]